MACRSRQQAHRSGLLAVPSIVHSLRSKPSSAAAARFAAFGCSLAPGVVCAGDGVETPRSRKATKRTFARNCGANMKIPLRRSYLVRSSDKNRKLKIMAGLAIRGQQSRYQEPYCPLSMTSLRMAGSQIPGATANCFLEKSISMTRLLSWRALEAAFSLLLVVGCYCSAAGPAARVVSGCRRIRGRGEGRARRSCH